MAVFDLDIQLKEMIWNFRLKLPPHFVYDLSRKIFLVLYSINWSNFIVWLSLLLEVSGNMCIVIVCYAVCDVINFENYISFLIKPFSFINKRSSRKFEYLKNEKNFKGEVKNIFHHF